MEHTKAKVSAIIFNWKEGREDPSDFPFSVKTWAEANDRLRTWSNDAPKNGTYDKVSFAVVWENGDEYKGRYDLMHYSVPDEHCDLGRHIRENLEFWAGLQCPDHMTPERYEKFTNDHFEARRSALDDLNAVYFRD